MFSKKITLFCITKYLYKLLITASEGAFCGNKIVEDGEECDCGYDEVECDDKCCYPRQITDKDRYHNSSARGCARRAQTECRYTH